MIGVLNCKFVKESVVTRYHIIYELDSLKDNFQKYGKVYVTNYGWESEFYELRFYGQHI